jgi:hypothetical protein
MFQRRSMIRLLLLPPAANMHSAEQTLRKIRTGTAPRALLAGLNCKGLPPWCLYKRTAAWNKKGAAQMTCTVCAAVHLDKCAAVGQKKQGFSACSTSQTAQHKDLQCIAINMPKTYLAPAMADQPSEHRKRLDNTHSLHNVVDKCPMLACRQPASANHCA